MVRCDKCNGSGVTDYTYPDGDHEHTLDEVCTQCNGTGELPDPDADDANMCKKCNGKGGDFPADGSPWEVCGACNGSGVHTYFDDENPFKPPELRPAMPFNNMVTRINVPSIYQRAIYLWGEQAQIGMAIEECGELIVKLVKIGRNTNGSTREEIAEEIADVEIMMKQLRCIFGDGFVEYQKRLKLLRLKKRIEYGEGTA